MKFFPQQLKEGFLAVARAYAVVIFSGSITVGCLLGAASLLAPWIGLVGLAGVVIALIAARMAGFERAAIDDGRLLFNSLLCSLALGYWAPPGALSPLMMGILIVAVPLTALGCTLVLNQATFALVSTASRSLPYCMVGTGLSWLLSRLIASDSVPESLTVEQIQLPALLTWWAHSLGTLFFAPTIIGGLLATAALVWASRLNLIFALVGYSISALVLAALGFSLEQSSWLQLDAILCAMALGGVFFVPSRASLALAALGAGLCVLAGVGLTQGLRWIDAPLLTLPFNFVVLGVSAAMRWRAPGREPHAVLLPSRNPEATFQADRLWKARHPEAELPAIVAPFEGSWVVTQGFDDQLTHRSAWKHALDFEVADASGEPSRPSSAEVRDFPSFNAPVLSPAEGRVVRLVDDIADNAIGDNNLADNWGNSLVIEIAPNLHVQLSHFRQRGFKVREGDRVRQGQLLGYLGNSGRSPVPHLHMQMQTLPDIGASTIPFRMRGYRTPASAGGTEFHFRGLPRRGEVVLGARTPRWMEECLMRGEEKTTAYRVFTAQGEHRETIHEEWTGRGALILHSVETRARVHLVFSEGVWMPVEFHGARQSLLAAFQGVGRLPWVTGEGVRWVDYAIQPLRAGWGAGFVEGILAPFLGTTLRAGRAEVFQFDLQEQRFAVRWTSPDHFIAELNFTVGLGLTAGRMETRDYWLRFLAEEGSVAAENAIPVTTVTQTREYALI